MNNTEQTSEEALDELPTSPNSYHLFLDDNRLNLTGSEAKPFQKLTHWQYFKRRVQFWKYRKHRTMGKPILMRWRNNREHH